MAKIQHIWQRIYIFCRTTLNHKEFLRDVLWMTGGYGLRTGVQIAYFILLARTLKPEAFGMFTGIQAMVNLFSAFSSWGSGNILVKQVSRRVETFSLQWGTALTVTILLSSAFELVAVLISGVVYSIETTLHVTLPIALGDLLGMSMVSISAQAFQAYQKFSRTSLIWTLLTSSRFVMTIIFFLLPLPKTLQLWANLYSISGLLAGGLALVWVHRELGWGGLTLRGMRGQWKEGMYFSVGLSAQGAYNDLDKTLLSRMVNGSIAGAYSSAYRIMDAMFIPVRALLASAYPHFFKKGEKSLKDASRYAFRLLPLAVIWATLAWLVLILTAPLLPVILGVEYDLASNIVVWLGPILIFRAIHYLLADTLTGSNFQGKRSVSQVGVALFNLGLNLWLIPKYGWMGAMISSLASDGILLVIFAIYLVILTKRENTRLVSP